MVFITSTDRIESLSVMKPKKDESVLSLHEWSSTWLLMETQTVIRYRSVPRHLFLQTKKNRFCDVTAANRARPEKHFFCGVNVCSCVELTGGNRKLDGN